MTGKVATPDFDVCHDLQQLANRRLGLADVPRGSSLLGGRADHVDAEAGPRRSRSESAKLPPCMLFAEYDYTRCHFGRRQEMPGAETPFVRSNIPTDFAAETWT